MDISRRQQLNVNTKPGNCSSQNSNLCESITNPSTCCRNMSQNVQQLTCQSMTVVGQEREHISVRSSLKLSTVLQALSGPSRLTSQFLIMSSAIRFFSYVPVSKMIACFLVLALTLNLGQSEAQGVGVCIGVPCANRGRLMVDNSVWGHCRCKCRPGFLGPYCQFTAPSKRSADSFSPRRIGRSEQFEQIRQRLLGLYATMERSASTLDGAVTDESVAGDLSDDYSVVGDLGYVDQLLSSGTGSDTGSETLDRLLRIKYMGASRR